MTRGLWRSLAVELRIELDAVPFHNDSINKNYTRQVFEDARQSLVPTTVVGRKIAVEIHLVEVRKRGIDHAQQGPDFVLSCFRQTLLLHLGHVRLEQSARQAHDSGRAPQARAQRRRAHGRGRDGEPAGQGQRRRPSRCAARTAFAGDVPAIQVVKPAGQVEHPVRLRVRPRVRRLTIPAAMARLQQRLVYIVRGHLRGAARCPRRSLTRVPTVPPADPRIVLLFGAGVGEGRAGPGEAPVLMGRTVHRHLKEWCPLFFFVLFFFVTAVVEEGVRVRE